MTLAARLRAIVTPDAELDKPRPFADLLEAANSDDQPTLDALARHVEQCMAERERAARHLDRADLDLHEARRALEAAVAPYLERE